MYRVREANNPLLVIYVIDKRFSSVRSSQTGQRELFSSDQFKEHVIGLAIAFPETNESEEERRHHATEFWALRRS